MWISSVLTLNMQILLQSTGRIPFDISVRKRGDLHLQNVNVTQSFESGRSFRKVVGQQAYIFFSRSNTFRSDLGSLGNCYSALVGNILPYACSSGCALPLTWHANTYLCPSEMGSKKQANRKPRMILLLQFVELKQKLFHSSDLLTPLWY